MPSCGNDPSGRDLSKAFTYLNYCKGYAKSADYATVSEEYWGCTDTIRAFVLLSGTPVCVVEQHFPMEEDSKLQRKGGDETYSDISVHFPCCTGTPPRLAVKTWIRVSEAVIASLPHLEWVFLLRNGRDHFDALVGKHSLLRNYQKGEVTTPQQLQQHPNLSRIALAYEGAKALPGGSERARKSAVNILEVSSPSTSVQDDSCPPDQLAVVSCPDNKGPQVRTEEQSPPPPQSR